MPPDPQTDSTENTNQSFVLGATVPGGGETSAKLVGRPEDTAHGVAHMPRFTRRSFLRTATAAAVAFAGGLGVGFSELGPTPVVAESATDITLVPHRQVVAALSLPDSYTLPVTYGQVGPHLIRAGAIDYDAFLAIYEQGAAPLSKEQKEILSGGSEEAVVINLNNARFLLNFFWAAGLADNNAILRTGQMVSNDNEGGVEGYASTGGWSLTTKPLHMVYSGSAIVNLAKRQQARLEEAAAAIYRPCCNNSTAFPDCNHGMAMLGLLELMAAQDASVDEMLEAAKIVNRFWFPEQTSHLALYYQAQGAESFDAIPAREAVSLDRFSASGYAAVHNWLVANGRIGTPGQGGSNCGV